MSIYPQQLQLPAIASGAPRKRHPLLNVIHCVDALVLMKTLSAGSVDAIIADPPYNLTELHFERDIDWTAFWVQARRVLSRKNSPVILFSQQPFTTDLIISNRKGWRDEIIYEKSLPTGFLNANRQSMNCHENIQIFADAEPDYCPQMESTRDVGHSSRRRTKADHYNGTGDNIYVDTGARYPRSVWRFAQRNTSFKNTKTLHPNEKPVGLMERLILTYTKAGEIVLDPFAGSGSTLAAARNNGRSFIGADTDAGYVRVARHRLAQPHMMSMFAEMQL